MENKSVEIIIADRKYPVIVPANEEKVVREAESIIKERLEKWQKQVTAKDNQDYLALTLLTQLVEILKEKNDRETKLKFLDTKIQSMNKQISALELVEEIAIK
jgi:hypothetical protein